MNSIPTADAGPDQAEVEAGRSLELSGLSSLDADGDPLTCNWTQVSGPPLGIDGAGQCVVDVVPCKAGTYEFVITVTDDRGGSDQDTVRITVTGTADNCGSTSNSNDNVVASDNDNISPSTNDNIDTGSNDNGDNDGLLAESSFTSGAEGWVMSGNNISNPTVSASGGRLGGAYISIEDGSDEVGYWNAPDNFLGNKSSALGGWIEFSLAQSQLENQDEPYKNLMISGGGLELYLTLYGQPFQGWRAYRAAFSEDAGWRHESNDALATQADILVVLSSLDQLRIRGDVRYFSGEFLGLDEVRMTSASYGLKRINSSVESSLDSSTEGWLAINNGNLGASTPSHQDNGGRFGSGHVSIEDKSDYDLFWDAPSEFLGDASDAYGGALVFDLAQLYLENQDEYEDDVILSGGGICLYFDVFGSPAQGWTSVRVGLDDQSGWRRCDSTELATQAELLAVLSHLDQILIRGDYRYFREETIGLDWVRLELADFVPAVIDSDIVTDFDESDHGWTAINNGLLGASTPALSAGASLGQPFVVINDASDYELYWDAPPSYLGDVSAAQGGSIDFFLAQSLTTNQSDFGYDLLLRGDGLTLYSSLSSAPTTGLTGYSIPLVAGAGGVWRRVDTDELATETELSAVLGRLDQILIHGDYRYFREEDLFLAGTALRLP